MLTGGTEVEQYFESDEGRLFREPTATVRGSGAPDADVPEISGVYAETFDAETLIDAGAIQVVVRHGLSTPEPDDFSATLSATWTVATGESAAIKLSPRLTRLTNAQADDPSTLRAGTRTIT